MSDPTTEISFLDLPVELIEHTLVYLHPLEIVLCRQESHDIVQLPYSYQLIAPQLCKGLLELIDASVEIKLRIELAIGGCLLGERGNMPASELLRRVRARQTAYETFHPQWVWEIEDSSGTTGTHQFEVSDGIWGYSEHEGPNTAFRKLHFEELAPPGYEGGRWELVKEDIGIDATDFSYWLGMDALVLMEPRENGDVRRMHFRQLSVNEPHPLAALPFIDILKEDCEVWESCNTVSYEERVALVFGDSEGGIRRTAVLILDWRMGQILLPFTIISDVAFLTKELIVLAQTSPDDDGLMEFDIWSLAAGCSLYRCKLPLPATQYHPWFLTHPASNHSGHSPTKQAKIFIPDPTVEILGIVFRSIPAEPTIPSESFTVALSIHLFIQRCERLAAADKPEDSKGGVAPVFNWEQWGPPVTRWFPSAIHGEVGVRTTFGSRMLAVLVPPVQQGNLLNRVHTMMMDFNPRPIARGAQSAETDEYIFRVFDHEATWETGVISGVSALPCRAWISTRRCLYLNLFLDGNTIVGRLNNAYHCFSFLPRTQPDEEEKVPPRIL